MKAFLMKLDQNWLNFKVCDGRPTIENKNEINEIRYLNLISVAILEEEKKQKTWQQKFSSR